MLLEEADSVPAALLRVIVPLAAANGHAVITGQPFLPAGRDQLLAAALEKGRKVGRRGLLFLFLGKGYELSNKITSYGA